MVSAEANPYSDRLFSMINTFESLSRPPTEFFRSVCNRKQQNFHEKRFITNMLSSTRLSSICSGLFVTWDYVNSIVWVNVVWKQKLPSNMLKKRQTFVLRYFLTILKLNKYIYNTYIPRLFTEVMALFFGIFFFEKLFYFY